MEIGARRAECHRIGQHRLTTVNRAGGNRHALHLRAHQQRVDRSPRGRGGVDHLERSGAGIEVQSAIPGGDIEEIAGQAPRHRRGSNRDRSTSAGLEGIHPRTEIDIQRATDGRGIERSGHATTGKEDRQRQSAGGDRGRAIGADRDPVAAGGPVDDQIVADHPG